MLGLTVSVACALAKTIVNLLSSYRGSSMLPQCLFCSRYVHLYIVLVLNVFYAILGDNLDEDALEVDRKTSLELLCTHAHDLETFLVVDVRVVVLV